MKKQTFIQYSHTIVITLIISFVTAIFSLLQTYLLSVAENEKHAAVTFDESITVVIDAGHGGEDSGAVGVGGTLEKNVNLAVAQYLKEYFSLTDINAVMTREGDYMLYKEGQEKRKKFNDLNNRLLFCNSYENPILISVHQNKFPIEKYNGLQVYYSVNFDGSLKIADMLQSKTKKYLQKHNTRQIKPAGRSIYILHKAECPAVLVECGFLSNTEEEKKLNDCEYQKKIAFLVFSSVVEYVSSEKIR